MSPFEPERYELHAGPTYTFDLNRRDIFKLLGGGPRLPWYACTGLPYLPSLPSPKGSRDAR